jgi:hypothetical protein
MSLSNASETAWLQLVFQNIDWTGVGNAGGLRGSTAAGNFYLVLHTADPGEAGDQQTNEITDVGRLAVARSASGFDVSGNQVSNHAIATFGVNAGSQTTATYFSIGVNASGASQIIGSGALSSPFVINTGVAPYFDANQLVGNAN